MDGADARGSLPDHYQVVVHVEEAALRGEAARSDLPIETVRRLCCEGSLTVLVEDEKGHPLAVSRKTGALSAALRRAVEARDRHCTFPGCRRTEGTVPHHIKPWGEGGEHAAR